MAEDLGIRAMYLDDLAAIIRTHIPNDRMPKQNADQLLRLYAVLLRAKGASVTQSDVHDAWSAWMSERDRGHVSLVKYEDLPEEVQADDRIFTVAIQHSADQLGLSGPSQPLFTETLFPSGPPENEADNRQAFDLYKIMVQSSEGLVSRRQAVNTFFLTMNGALLTASGIIVQSSRGNRLGALGIAILAIAGAILCAAWRSLITSFGQLNRGKFQVINALERYFKAAIYAAEWEALGRGENPSVYRSFTSREIWVPNALLVLHIVTAILGSLVATRQITLG
jgi:hypothetical protein